MNSVKDSFMQMSGQQFFCNVLLTLFGAEKCQYCMNFITNFFINRCHFKVFELLSIFRYIFAIPTPFINPKKYIPYPHEKPFSISMNKKQKKSSLQLFFSLSKRLIE